MFFGPVATTDARGAILGHSLSVGGERFRKGRVLSDSDVSALLAAGHAEVYVARLDAGDMPEDEAAGRIATAAAGAGTRVAAAFTGRANIYAAVDGLALIDPQRLASLNGIDEALTMATVARWEPVETGQMLATVKIIPFAAPRSAIDHGEALLRGDDALVQVAAFRPRDFGLVLTRVSETKPSVLAKTEQAVAGRLRHMGSRISATRTVPHDTASVATAIADLQAGGCSPILVFGASATVDRGDVVPAGLVKAGGTVTRFGMPVDPGNLLVMGELGDVPVVGVPGCARSPKLNGFDWVLQRLCAGVSVSARDIVAMGLGGLLKEIPSRPMPRDTAPVPRLPRRPNVPVVILAAGLSSRFGAGHKLLAEIDGRPVIRHVVDTAMRTDNRPVVLVTGHQAEAVVAAAGHPEHLKIVHNSDFSAGLASSLRVGLGALPGDADGVLVCLGDMPDVTPDVLEQLTAAFNPTEGRAICVPVFKGKRGNPTLWGAQFFPEIARLQGDTGARTLFTPHADWICEVPVDTVGILQDYDTPEMLAARQSTVK